MSEIERLIKNYERFVRLPWERNLAGPQKVWFVVYDKAQERRLRFRIPEFEITTKNAGHGWVHHDLTDAFAEWMAAHEYREAYFEDPEALDLALADQFLPFLAQRLRAVLSAPGVDDDTVVAISGVGALFGLARVSLLVDRVSPSIRGRLLVFFPGSVDINKDNPWPGRNFRLLDARDGWDYHAIVITADAEVWRP